MVPCSLNFARIIKIHKSSGYVVSGMHFRRNVFWESNFPRQLYSEPSRKNTLITWKTNKGGYLVNGVHDGSIVSQSDRLYQKKIFLHLFPTNGLAGP